MRGWGGEDDMWKTIKDHPNYAVSTEGEVINKITGVLVSQWLKNGYLAITVKDPIKKHLYVHRLVMEAFISNTNNKKYVNHIDANRKNNNISNLEWATPSENIRHHFDNFSTIPIPIVQISLSGEVIQEFKSASHAARVLKISQGTLWMALNGKRKKCFNSYWVMKDQWLRDCA